MRWLIVAVLGGFHGLYFALFLRTTGYSPLYVLAGAAAAETGFIGICALAFSYIVRRLAALQPVRVCASVLLAIGLAWFFLRLRS